MAVFNITGTNSLAVLLALIQTKTVEITDLGRMHHIPNFPKHLCVCEILSNRNVPRKAKAIPRDEEGIPPVEIRMEISI